MKAISIQAALFRVALGLSLIQWVPSAPAAATLRLTREDLLDKIRGAWAGQMIGVSYGAATEFNFNGRIIEGPIKPEPLSNAIDQDDLYVEMTFARVMDTVGLKASAADYGAAFRDSKYSLWHANAGARRNLNRGLQPPWTGHPRYNLHADDIDFQIESDFIGIMCPGLPRTAGQLCETVGQVMNAGDGILGGVFVCGMYSAAYEMSDPRAVVEAGLACLPAKSGYALVIRDLLRWHREFPDDWRKAWQALQDKWDKNDPCPDGAFSEFNIDARLNGAYIAMGLLYGGGDFDRTMEISTRCGQDSDCNPSNAAGVMGTILGYRKIPARHRAEIDKLANQKFAFTEYSFNDIVLSTETRALQAIREAGGKVTDGDVTIRKQTPKPVRVKPSNIGIPRETLAPEASAWTWGPGWTTENGARVAQAAGREATLKFEGSGVALIGVLRQDGGRADVYLDGKLQAPVADAWIPERTNDNDLWHMIGLKSGPHILRIVTREDADARSKGKRVAIERALIYRAP